MGEPWPVAFSRAFRVEQQQAAMEGAGAKHDFARDICIGCHQRSRKRAIAFFASVMASPRSE